MFQQQPGLLCGAQDMEVFLRDFQRFLGRETNKERGFLPVKQFEELDQHYLDLRERLILEGYGSWDLEQSSSTNSNILAICFCGLRFTQFLNGEPQPVKDIRSQPNPMPGTQPLLLLQPMVQLDTLIETIQTGQFPWAHASFPIFQLQFLTCFSFNSVILPSLTSTPKLFNSHQLLRKSWKTNKPTNKNTDSQNSNPFLFLNKFHFSWKIYSLHESYIQCLHQNFAFCVDSTSLPLHIR